MRINSICVAQKTNYPNYRSANYAQNPNFKGWGGALGTLGGAAAGIGLTILTGGAALWTVPLISGLSGIGGDMFEKKDKPSSDDY